MNVAIRADASVKIGSGHIMRCLTLAEGLRQQGADVLFICRDLPNNLSALISEMGFELCRLHAINERNSNLDWNRYADWLGVHWCRDAEETQACLQKKSHRFDWLIVDHYALDKYWETGFRVLVDKIMVIDDLANRQHDCDLLLDQNLYPDMDLRYQKLLPVHAEQLNGPNWALLRQEFHVLRERGIKRDGQIRRIFVFMGGSDLENITSMVLSAMSQLEKYEFKVDVIVGEMNPNRSAVKKLCMGMSNVSFHCQVSNISQLMVNSDLAIGGGGTATWERCSVKLPALVVSIAENQTPIAKAVHDAGAAILLGEAGAVDENQICNALKQLFTSTFLLREMGERAGRLVDTRGTQRVVRKMLDLS